MSILNEVINMIKNNDETKTSSAEHPCDNCPSTCAICPDACEACKPYKEKLAEAIYWVEHRDELTAKYEVTGTATAESGSTICPYCGAPSSNPYVCEYCDMKIQEGTEKIRVASASDIPNPVIQARDIIYERYANVVAKYDTTSTDTSSSGSLLGNLLGNLFNSDDSEDTSNPLGSKMTEQEITDTANAYGVSVSAYLNGLDAGTYLTAAAKAKASSYTDRDTSSTAAGVAGVAGVAGTAAVIGSLLNNRTSGSTRSNSGRNMPPPPPDGYNGNNSNQRSSYSSNRSSSNGFSTRSGNTRSGNSRGSQGGPGGGMGRGPQGGPGGGMGRGPQGGPGGGRGSRGR